MSADDDRSVSWFADELRGCLSEMLRSPVPEPGEAALTRVCVGNAASRHASSS